MSGIVYMGVIVICALVLTVMYRDEIIGLMPWELMKKCREKGAESLNRWIIKGNNILLDRELFAGSVILKNLSLVRKETPLSADYIYEKLMENSRRLKPVYGRMITLYRNGKDEEAFKVFALEIGTKTARNFALILSKLDKINPAELVEQMDVFQQMMTEKNVTAAMKKAQRNSLITTACAVSAVFALLINFAVVVVFMDTINLLNNLFI